MPEIPPVIPGEFIFDTWGNPVARRTVQRYSSESNRTTLNPTPEQGDLSFLLDTNVVSFFDGLAWIDVSRVGFDSVFTAQEDTRTLSTYGGDASTTLTMILEAGFVEVCWSGSLSNTDAGDFVSMSFQISGATTLPSQDNNSISVQSAIANQRIDLGSSRIVAVNAGSNTFTAQYSAATGGTAQFRRRFLSVKQL